MTKGLEALEYLKNKGMIHNNAISRGCIKDIEKELKEYEMEHTLRIRLENINYELVREKQENEKKLKALEIIKEECLLDVYVYQLMLPQEEYELLKEVLK